MIVTFTAPNAPFTGRKIRIINHLKQFDEFKCKVFKRNGELSETTITVKLDETDYNDVVAKRRTI